MQKECVVCFGPLVYGHLGVNCCRACAVFYKRALEAKTELKCKMDDERCMETNSKTTCRLCRFTRIKEILKKASEDPPSIESNDAICEPTKTVFLNHESFYECEPSTSRTPLLDRLRRGYSLMCLIRHGGEMGTRMKVYERLESRVGNMVLVPATYSTIPVHGQTCKEAMKAFASYAFDDFRKLDEECKEFLIRKALGALNSLDAAYRSMHHFPDDEEIRLPGYTTYLKPQEIEHFLAGCTDDVNIEKISGEIRNSLKRSVNGVRQYFKQIKPTDYEFVALLGLSLWNDDVSNVNGKLQEIGEKYRESIMRELHAYYAQQGILDYAIRIGHLHSILVGYQDYVAILQEDLEMCKLMNLFQGLLGQQLRAIN